MLRIEIRATPDTDVEAETEKLRRAVQGAGLGSGQVNRIVREADTVVRDFLDRGCQLKALGSHLKIQKTIRGDGYDIRISFDTAQRWGLIARILAVLHR